MHCVALASFSSVQRGQAMACCDGTVPAGATTVASAVGADAEATGIVDETDGTADMVGSGAVGADDTAGDVAKVTRGPADEAED